MFCGKVYNLQNKPGIAKMTINKLYKNAHNLLHFMSKSSQKKCGHFVETPGINWYKELGLFSVKHEMVLNQESNKNN